MASTYLDEFVLNFDLNQLSTEQNVHVQTDQRYEKLRKYTSWLKSKIISTDFAIQKYQSKKDDYERSVKAHSATKDELKQACINYQEALEKCTYLEKENKIFLANQDTLQQKVVEVETKYDALLSHANQLQILVKQLENEKDALIVEKELDKCNNKDSKDSSKEIIELQKEKEEMLNDIMAFKDVIFGKRKSCKRHINLMKKYFKDKKYKGTKMLCTSEESDNDTDNFSDVSSHNLSNLNKIHNITDKELVSSEEQIDNYSDEEISVDTGRGSSRANSHDKCPSSLDYVVSLETLLKMSPKNVKAIDTASSPIIFYPPRSVATSPIMFEPAPVLENGEYNDYTDCFDSQEYADDDEDIPLSEDIDILVAQEKLSDCASPVSDLCNLTNMGTEVVEHNNYIILKEVSDSSVRTFLRIDSNESNGFNQDVTTEQQSPKCLCEKSDTITMHDPKKLVDSCTSPLPIPPDLRKFVDIGTSTVEHNDSIILNKINDLENQLSSYCEKSTSTDSFKMTERKEFVNACTSPIARSYNQCKAVDVGTNTVESNNQSKNLVEACDNSKLVMFKQPKAVDIGKDVVHQEQKEKSRKSVCINLEEAAVTDKPTSKCLKSTELLRTQEKVCLESNSSKNLRFESTNDSEVQDILNIMKLRHDLISPISKTPCDSNYLKLIPEMNNKITKIWNALANIYRNPNRLRKSNSPELHSIAIDDIEEIPEIETNKSTRNSVLQHLEKFRDPNRVSGEDIMKNTDSINVDTSTLSTNNVSSESSNMCINGEDQTDVIDLNVTRPDSKTDKVIIMAEDDETQSQQQQAISDLDVNENSKDNSNLTSNRNENNSTANTVFNKEKGDIQHNFIANKSDLNEFIADNTNNVNKTDTFTVSKVPKSQTIIMLGTKTKKKSKLDKFRKKLLPTSKIKKMPPPIIKHSSKVKNIKSRDTKISASLNQKIAYDKAVKVMADLRLKQELHDKKIVKSAPGDTNLANTANTIESSSSEMLEPRILCTRSRTRRLSKKEEDNTISANTENNIRDIEKSPINRKTRKRPADSEVDSLQKCKRVLRSSNASQVTNEKAAPITSNESAVENVRNNLVDVKECKGQVNHPDDSLRNSKNENSGTAKSNMICDKSLTRRMKPVIELSKCLTDDSNVLSIIHGNIGYLDVNKNINHTNKLTEEFNSHMSDDETEYSHTNNQKSKISNDVSIIEMPELISTSKFIQNVKQDRNDVSTSFNEANKVIRKTRSCHSPKTNDHTDEKSFDEANKVERKTKSCESPKTNGHSDDKSCNRANNVVRKTKSFDFPKTNDHSNNKSLNEANKVVRKTKSCDSPKTNDHSNDNDSRRSRNRRFSSISIDKTLHNDDTNEEQKSLELKLRQEANIRTKDPVVQLVPLKSEALCNKQKIVSYSDLDMYTTESNLVDKMPNAAPIVTKTEPRNSQTENILCTALDRYGVISVKYAATKVPDTVTNKICKTIEETITKIIALPKAEQKSKMDELVSNLQTNKTKCILAGFMKYLMDPTRKIELFNKIVNGAAPAMTKSEMILLYVIERLNGSLPTGFIKKVWNNIEHALFQLNRSPGFDVIESMSHFYAVLCRYFRNKSRLRCFMLDAMYCLQFKAVPLIRQCLDVCPGVLPSAHEHMAKTSLVTCLVYLLHFYKCQDKFNRAQDIRTILNRKYRYQFSEWNETMILEIFRKAIMDLRGTHNDKKMLRVALIILCKRHGAKWCQINIIQNILMPIIEKNDVPERIKQFCVLMLGPLLKPFPADRKAQCEIVINQLFHMLKEKPSQEMKEAIHSSLIFMNKHDQDRVVQALLSWNPVRVSPEFEEILNDYVMEKPLSVWKKLVIRKPSQCS